ncbi:MAG: hypothetical protein ACRDJK_07680, partial [Actinomycetota bacterium]
MTTHYPTTPTRHNAPRSLLGAGILMALTLGVLDRAHAEAGVPLPFEVRPQALDRALVEFSLA